MFSILLCIGESHDVRFVAASIAVCVIGAFCTVIMLARAQECMRHRREFWVAAASAVAGTSVWATHFMAMLAYDGGFPIAYDVGVTALSIVISILTAWASFSLAFRWSRAGAIVAAGGGFGVGVALMHFVGMSALDSPGHLTYTDSAVGLAIVSSILLGALSLLSVRQLQGWKRAIAGTSLISLTVCTLHFTSMAGLTLVPDPAQISHRLLVIDRPMLATIVAVVSCAIVLAGCAAAITDRLLTDVRGLADASLEGLFILFQGQVLEVNERAVILTGLDRSDLMGRNITDIVTPALDPLYNAASPLGGIATLAPLTGRKTEVEVFVRDIEYRGRQCSVAVLRDMTDRRRAERMIDHMARHDPLTDLLNRREFDRHLDALCSAGDRNLALLCLDLDNFKLVNDMGGHAAGDDILRQVAEILENAASQGGLAFRLGGDEFAIIQTGHEQPEHAQRTARKILQRIEHLSATLGITYFGCSIGIARFPQFSISAEALHSRADAALYAAKEAGRGQVRSFESAVEEHIQEANIRFAHQ